MGRQESITKEEIAAYAKAEQHNYSKRTGKTLGYRFRIYLVFLNPDGLTSKVLLYKVKGLNEKQNPSKA